MSGKNIINKSNSKNVSRIRNITNNFYWIDQSNDMELQTCMRGFSFMAKKTVEVIELKYVEKEELEQTWRTTRRQRLKDQEQRIWDQFVQEQDIVHSVCKDDPYQFLHQLPESCIKELLEAELTNMKKELIVEKMQKPEAPAENEEVPMVIDNQHIVTLVEEEDKEEMFHIFDDEVSGPEEEALNDSAGSDPCTVRERHSARCSVSPAKSLTKSLSPDKASSKSSENVTHMIESSIYCAKVKDLRIKINEELLDMIASLERQDPARIEPEEVARVLKRSTEFCARFNRIYLYQLHRQLHDVQRGNAAALPFAKHTQFQSQMVRIVSLHQNMLQTAQIFHRALPQTACARDSGEALRTLLRAVHEAGAVCRAAAPPVAHLYQDDIDITCGKLEDCLDKYTERLTEYLNNFGHVGKSKKNRNKGQKRSIAGWSKSGSKSGTETEARLSMYSLDTLRLNLHPKSTSSKGCFSGTSKVRCGLSRRKQDDKEEQPKSQRRSPRSRRPLMRDPAAGKPRRRQPRDLDVPTLVETVGACASSLISREDTPRQTPRDSNQATPRRAKDDGSQKETSRKHLHTPRIKWRSPNSAKKLNSPVKNADGDKVGAKEEDKDVAKMKNEVKDEAKIKAQVKVRGKVREEAKVKAEAKDAKNDAVKAEKNAEGEKIQKIHDIKVELKPKSPEKIIENSMRAVKEQIENAKAQKQESNVESKRAHDTPRLRCEYGAEVGVGAECATRTERELTPRSKRDGNTEGRRSDRDSRKVMEVPGSCEVSRLLRQLCGGDAAGSRTERSSGAKNAQLFCVNSGGSPRQPSTPQLLRILEETIQKKAPKPLFPPPGGAQETARLRLALSVPEDARAALLQYRARFVQHMLTSCMYANSAVRRPWDMVASISDQIIDELLLGCAKEMELSDVIHQLYESETR